MTNVIDGTPGIKAQTMVIVEEFYGYPIVKVGKIPATRSLDAQLSEQADPAPHVAVRPARAPWRQALRWAARATSRSRGRDCAASPPDATATAPASGADCASVGTLQTRPLDAPLGLFEFLVAIRVMIQPVRDAHA